MDSDLQNILTKILCKYQKSFSDKVYGDENDEYDILMNIFSLTPETKRENAQYWGRELGMCWQSIVIEMCKYNCLDFKPALRINDDEPCDLRVGNYAIDTKYRLGSGDSGTLKKFRANGNLLIERGYTPTLVILRNDNLRAAINACVGGNWQVLRGQESMDFIHQISGIDIKAFLENNAGKYTVGRNSI
ncbi:restriction endonuclease [Nostoc sp. KVJ3]|uniref:restriction endonuclease n=1 Tax=Nostoc sp. KVJ3 TaxID=457945 RepID=UPI002237E532|nr:restriction endonuclease [Nostoc sp. KVJ3]MCW5312398.1 restriction endonuclease [Nostoc sp. KVJ3]